MKFEESLIKGRLIKRYKRFLADIKLSNGKIVTAHCPNPGSMLSLFSKGCEVWVSKKNNVKSKLLYSWELVKIKRNFVGINTLLTNKIAIEAIKNKRIEELSKHGYEEGREFVVIRVPNIIDISYGRGVGYSFTEHDLGKDIHKISATKIRSEMRKKKELE